MSKITTVSALLGKITATENLDVTSRLVNNLPAGVQVEATITRFLQDGDKSRILKKITVSSVNADFLTAQDAALEKAVQLLGL